MFDGQRRIRRFAVAVLAIVAVSFFVTATAAQPPEAEPSGVEQEQTARETEAAAENEVAEQIEVDPVAEDGEIESRISSLLRVLAEHRGFDEIEVEVEEGVVFLDGEVPSERQRNFAGEIARNVDGVVHVDNNLTVAEVSAWSLRPALAELESLGSDAVRFLPFLLAGSLLIAASFLIAGLARKAARRIFARSDRATILTEVFANLVSVPILLLGLFLALRVSGLTRLALSVLGGTGLFGLVVGIAFRDIFENFLASLLISTNRPFTIGDLVEVESHKGLVQAVTTRGTLLMTLDGDHVHIPNSVVYKAILRNLTSNPNRRLEFAVGIDYEDDPAGAQNAVLRAIEDCDVVLSDPPAFVVVEELGASTVNLRAYFWTNIRENNLLKVRSRVIRLVKQRLEAEGFTMPDEQREVIFPRGVPVLTEAAADASVRPRSSGSDRPSEAPPDGMENAEGNMESEEQSLRKQAAAARIPVSDETLLVSKKE